MQVRLLALAALLSGASWMSAPARAQSAPPDSFHVIPLDARTYAISEPKYWQQNVSYLLLGDRRALLFDTGPGIYSIRNVVKTLTVLPILVIPSHLHFDHVGRIQEFEQVALLDAPALRSAMEHGELVDSPPRYMLETGVKFKVSRWIRDGALIDLGGRKLMLIGTPGHTPDSVSLIEGSAKRAFTGDLINRIVTLDNVPGSNVAQSASSLHRLLQLLPAGSRAYEAHSETPWEPADLTSLAAGFDAIAKGGAVSKPMCLGGQPMRAYEIGAFSVLVPDASNELLRPLKSNVATLDWLGGACAK